MQTYGRSELLPGLQTSRLSPQVNGCQPRHEIPGLDTKDMVAHSSSSDQRVSVCPGSPSPTSHKVTVSGPGTPVHTVVGGAGIGAQGAHILCHEQ